MSLPLRSLLDRARVVARGSSMALRFEQAFRRWLARGTDGLVPAHGHRPGVVVLQPWVSETAVPWHLIALALLLHRRNRNTVILWDDTVVFRRDLTGRVEQSAIRRVLAQLPIHSYRLSDFTGPSPLGAAELKRIARLNAIKVHRGEGWPPAQERAAAQLEERLTQASGPIDGFLRVVQPSYLVVIGALFSTSGLYPPIARRRGVRVASMDFNPGIFQLSVDGVAAQLGDVPAAFARLGPVDEWAVARALEEFERRTKGKDHFGYQSVAPSGAAAVRARRGALLTLNQSHDGAALGLGEYFETMSDWLMQTVAWLLENTDEPIVVRQHPVERIDIGNDDYRARLRQRFGDQPRIRLVAAGDSVNTYDLVAEAKVVLPHSSSVGIEAAGLGVPVVVAANSYYAPLGFVWQGTSRDDYFAKVGQALAGELVVTDEQKKRAWTCYYLSQQASLLPSNFTPYAQDFERWSQESLPALFARHDVQTVLQAIDTATPLAVLRLPELRGAKA